MAFTAPPSAQSPTAKSENIFLSISPSGPGSTAYAQAVAHSNLVNNYSQRIKMTVNVGKGTGEITAWVQDGKVDMGNSSNIILPDAIKGGGQWGQRKPFPEVRVMWPQLPVVAQFAVHKDSPIKSVSDLKGKSVSHQLKSGTAAAHTWQMIEVLYKPGEVTQKHLSPHGAVYEALLNGEVDAAIAASGIPTPYVAEPFLKKDLRFLRVPP